MIVHPDAWLSEKLGRPAFAVASANVSAADLDAALTSHRAPAGAFFTAKIGILDFGALDVLEKHGFTVIETSLVFERPIERAAAVPQVSACRPEWQDAVLDIAEQTFRFTRFHVDPRIDRSAANRVKREWAKSYLDGRRGDALLVAHNGDTVLGFNAMLVSERPDGHVAIIDLIGVHPAHKGQRIGEQMIDAAAHHYQGRCRTIEVGTQASNIPSVRLYERAGFRLLRSGFVLHRHG